MFSRTWKGTKPGCLYSDQVDLPDTRSRVSDEIDLEKCEYITPLDPVEQTKVHGVNICGKREDLDKFGFSYENSKRVNTKTRKCVPSRDPCSNATSIENTICYPPEAHSICPIT